MLYTSSWNCQMRKAEHAAPGRSGSIGRPSQRPSCTDKKENKIFPLYWEIQRDRVQGHIWLTTASYMMKYLPFLIYMYDFAPDPIWISFYMRKILFSYQCGTNYSYWATILKQSWSGCRSGSTF
jgi:hypothetical protein